jgi:central glycolytic genes regulator
MAERRRTSPEELMKIQQENAVGEAFGYYFDDHGEVVHRVQTIGLQLRDLSKIPNVIAVAGGATKAKAIAAYLKQAPKSTVLVTDEGAASQLMKIIGN